MRPPRRVLEVLLIAFFVKSLAVTSAVRAQDAEGLVPRVPPDKPAETVVAPTEHPEELILKFAEGTGIRLREGIFVPPDDSSADPDLAQLEEILSAFRIPAHAIERLHTVSETKLDEERAAGERRSNRELADLNLYYKIAVPPGVDIGALSDQLNALDIVELAAPAPRPAPSPSDISPPTPDFSGTQKYRDAPPNGVGALDPAVIPGGDGARTKVVDIEYDWLLDHEDLELDAETNVDTEATPQHPFGGGTDHGTAVLGVLVGGANGYGITGIVPAANALVAPANTLEFGYNPARAIALAASQLGAGDAILIEQQTRVCGGGLYGPLEWHQSVFDAIAAATALDIVVVEAAGTGGMNLDDPSCGGRFDRAVRDSGAIIVGAGDPTDRSRLLFSSYGSRVDLQGWGSSVATTGYGTLFSPGDDRQKYADSFGGTSSASAIVAGAVLAVQGAVIAKGLAPIDPLMLRQVLVDTGTPQGNPTEQIGPLPDIAAALEASTQFSALAVAFDLLPERCPNRIRVVRGSTLRIVRAAILGTDMLDVSEIDVDTIRVGGVAPLEISANERWVRDMAAPLKPYIDEDSRWDCARPERDGFDDLLLFFDGRTLLESFGEVSDGEAIVVSLTAELLDGRAVRGEDIFFVRASHFAHRRGGYHRWDRHSEFVAE